MKSIVSRLTAFLLVWSLFLANGFGQDSAPAKATPDTSNPPATKNTPAPPDLKQLEQKFTETLTRATFKGRWCLIEDGKLGPDKEETYTITGVTKVGNDVWLIHARIQYGNKDVTVPVPVYVKWAGDTPVIQLTDAAIPGVGTYTARVVIYDKTYSGTWSGGKHAGMLHGVITNEK